MAMSSWVKSLKCKSRAFEDVYHHPSPKPRALIPSASCRHGLRSINDVIDSAAKRRSSSSRRRPKPDPRPEEPESPPPPPRRIRGGSEATLTELPAGHPSRNVVEIIFHTSWSPKAFSGRVEVIFKVQRGARAASRFEEYREAVRSRAGSGGGDDPKEDARCAADGNEVMGFHCLGPTPCDARAFPPESAVCTFSGSGGAHQSAGGGPGTSAMLVCRVLAGRLGFDSLTRDAGELLVFDPRAVLPCFLILYKL